MDTLPLPPRPNLAQYKKRAKDLVSASQSTDKNAIRDWAAEWIEHLARLRGVEITPFVQGSFDRAVNALEESVRERLGRAANAKLALADAQFLIAQAHSFGSWKNFADHVEELSRVNAAEGSFEAAADAVVDGDLEKLRTLLRAEPALVHEHSRRTHRATLLHYVAANGVEDFRQKTPPNAAAVARMLLEAGAVPDALASTYGGDTYQTTMNLLVSSTHPADAGLQPALVDILVDFGAAVDGVKNDSSPIMTALAFGYGSAAEALARRGARLDSVVAAAALGRLDLVQRLVRDARTLSPDARLVAPYWHRVADDPKVHIELALAWACKFGRADVARFLLGIGVDSRSKDNDEMTALHWAAANGLTDVVDILLERGAPLEAKNTWDGPVLNSTLHFAQYIPVAGVDYPAVIERLLQAGADVREADFPTGIAPIDEVLARHGARR